MTSVELVLVCGQVLGIFQPFIHSILKVAVKLYYSLL